MSQTYQYQKLDTSKEEIRLLHLLPGLPQEPIHVRIFHVPFAQPKIKSVSASRLTLSQLQHSLPEGWEAYETREGRTMFWYEDNNDTEITSWTHPDPSFPRECYEEVNKDEEQDDDTTSPKYEALSYTWATHVKRLDLLTRCGGNADLSQPSWVPDWSLRIVNNYDILAFCASGMTCADVLVSGDVLIAAGLLVSTVTTVETNITDIRDIHDFLCALGIDKLKAAKYRNGESLYDAYLQTFAAGMASDRMRIFVGYPSMEEWADIALHLHDSGGFTNFKRDLLDLFATTDIIAAEGGYIGLGPKAVRPVMVSLKDGAYKPEYLNTESNVTVSGDPRLDSCPLPTDWEPMEWTRTRDDPLFCQMFRNKATGETMNSDPRLLPEALRDRGFQLTEFKLV
ncbi:hypothetical protein B0T17DRAFT_615156 [Bombardia bombarda]|uniref:WW domain-containing protein n=1 Tax=Bombardia bombarda TaxID=252184 RepID=A0AA39X8N9_9PEZI|nr:hypothetical protein B0T17DRAFT_615156 [Bombardia bombarda]